MVMCGFMFWKTSSGKKRHSIGYTIMYVNG